MELESILLSYLPGNLAVRGVKVTKDPCLGGTANHAGGGGITVGPRIQSIFNAGINPLDTKIALHYRARFQRIQLSADNFILGEALAREVLLLVVSVISPLLVRTGNQTIAASHALVVVNDNDTIISPGSGACRADFNAGGFGAVIA